MEQASVLFGELPGPRDPGFYIPPFQGLNASDFGASLSDVLQTYIDSVGGDDCQVS